jgi:hypothetical protein
MQFSTGLTKSAIMECITNAPPVTQADSTLLCVSTTSRTAKVNVIANDTDANNNTVFLTSAEFVNSADEALAYITVNAADSTITLTLRPNIHIGVGGHLFNIIYYVKDNGHPASQCATGLLKVKAYPTPNYPDIRILACGNAGELSLAKYIDTMDNITSIHWASQMGITINPLIGNVSTNGLTAGVYTFTYTVSSRCVSEQKRKVYLKIPKNDIIRLPKDTVVICHFHAEVVNINQIFGIEAGGDWEYESLTSADNIDDYVTTSTNGAMLLNGKGVFDDPTVSQFSYHGVDAKMVKFTYTVGSNSICLPNKYTVVIVLTEDILK